MNIEDFINNTVKVEYKNKPKVYIASKTFNAPIIKEFVKNNQDLFISTATWIDLKPDSHFVKHEKHKLWHLCLTDIKNSDFVVLFSANKEDDHNGALVEVGHAMALGKEVFEIGTSFRTEPSDNSDVAYTYYNLFTKLNYDTLQDGFYYIKNHRDYWL